MSAEEMPRLNRWSWLTVEMVTKNVGAMCIALMTCVAVMYCVSRIINVARIIRNVFCMTKIFVDYCEIECWDIKLV